MANSHDEGRARASPENACPALQPAPNIPRAPRVVTCRPSTPDFFPNTIGTIAESSPLSPPIARPLRLCGWTSCSTQTAIPPTRPPAHSPRPRRHAQFPALRQDPTELALANVRQAARRSDHVLKHPAASAGRCASGRRLRGCRAWYLRRRPRQRHSRKPVVRGFPSPWPPANAAAPGRMAFRPRDPAHKVAARAPDRLVCPVASSNRSWRRGLYLVLLEAEFWPPQ